MDLNRATLIGRLTRDPEMRTTNTGQNVVSFAIATGRTWKDQNGVKQERTEFHNCVAWGKLADIIQQYLTKGKQVFVEGRIETRSWDGQDGVKKYRSDIVLDNLIMLGSGQGNSGNAPASGGVPLPTPPPAAPVSDDEIKVEDIPF